jgi:hypothetical protein
MSQKEAVLLVSRALALYLLCWVFSELSNIPVLLFSLAHHVSRRGVLAASDYFSDYDVLSLRSVSCGSPRCLGWLRGSILVD